MRMRLTKRGLVLGFLASCFAAGFISLIVLLNLFSYFCHGRLVSSWADQAIWDEDPEARRQAVEVLLEALPNIHGWQRTELLQQFCHPEKEGRGEKYPLPNEVRPFLKAAMESGEKPAAGYAAIALGVGYPPGGGAAMR